ncbi:SDR family NAD(P)-dependent oxidoreductase [Pseudomonas sp. B392_1p]|uniref:SDR family NAD(P)-dependent oxidoreductase n=1 Tax=Pseudomonas sp. B392_1p TaxID=3457507 RepID=UPI003FD07E8B
MELNSNVSAVVVGGASGMGEATVRALRSQGVHVAILDLDEDKGKAVAAETGAAFFRTNVTDEESVIGGFESARAVNGQERILVTTPGGGGLSYTAWRDAESGAIRRHDFQRFNRIISLNLSGTFLCASVAAAGMMNLPSELGGDRGVIVMTSSVASKNGPAATIAYVAAKAGIDAMTLSMARDLAPEAIRVNTILPGSFETPLIASVPENYKAGMRDWNLHPKRFGHPDEYAMLALHIIENSYLNAALLRLDGGARV